MKNGKAKMKKIINDNRGVALISIMIAVAFVSIIGSALLYLSYTNFQMKIMNLRSKENFYETDGKLIEITTAIRNASNGTTDGVKACFTDDDGDGIYNYDLTSILAPYGITPTMTADNGDIFEITGLTGVTTAPTKDGSNITIYKVPALTVAQKTSDGGYDNVYKNKVQTEMEIKVKATNTASGGPKGVGDFSILMDNSISIESNNFSFLTMYGDAYFSSYYYGADDASFGAFPTGAGNSYTMPGPESKPALYIASDTKVNVMGDYCVIYGDLVLEKNACLYIGNPKTKLMVYGDIYLKDNATLICAGTLHQATKVPGRDLDCSIHYTSGDWNDHIYYPAGESGIVAIDEAGVKAFCETLKLNDNDKDNDGISAQILPVLKDVEYTKSGGGTAKKDFDFFEQYDNEAGPYNKNFYGTDLHVVFSGKDNAEGFKSMLGENSLLFIARKKGTYTKEVDVEDSPVHPWTPEEPWYSNAVTHKETKTFENGTSFKSSVIKSTIISRQPITLEVEEGCYMSKLENNFFNYLTITDDTDPYYSADIHQFDFNFAGGGGSEGSGNFFGAGAKLSSGDFVPASKANQVVSDLVTKALNSGAGGTTTYTNSISFAGTYVKDPYHVGDEFLAD